MSPEETKPRDPLAPPTGDEPADGRYKLEFGKKWHVAMAIVYAAIAIMGVYIVLAMIRQQRNYDFEERLSDPSVPFEEFAKTCRESDWGGGVVTYLASTMRYDWSPLARLNAAKLLELYVVEKASKEVGVDTAKLGRTDEWGIPISSSVRAGFAPAFAEELNLESVSFALQDESPAVRRVARKILRLTGTDARHHQQRAIVASEMEDLLDVLKKGPATRYDQEARLEELAAQFDNLTPFLLGPMLPRSLGGAGQADERTPEDLAYQERCLELLLRVTKAKQAASTQRRAVSVFGRRNSALLVIALADPNTEISTLGKDILQMPSRGELLSGELLVKIKGDVAAETVWYKRIRAARVAVKEIDSAEGRRGSGLSERIEKGVESSGPAKPAEKK